MKQSKKSIESMSIYEIVDELLEELTVSKSFNDQVERITKYYLHLPGNVRKSLKKYFQLMPVYSKRERSIATVIDRITPFFTLLISVGIASLGIVGAPAMIEYYDFIIKNSQFSNLAQESLGDSVSFIRGLLCIVGALVILWTVFIGVNEISNIVNEKKEKRLSVIKSIIESIDENDFDISNSLEKEH